MIIYDIEYNDGDNVLNRGIRLKVYSDYKFYITSGEGSLLDWSHNRYRCDYWGTVREGKIYNHVGIPPTLDLLLFCVFEYDV